MLKKVNEALLMKPEVLKSENLTFWSGRRERNQQRAVLRGLHEQDFKKYKGR